MLDFNLSVAQKECPAGHPARTALPPCCGHDTFVRPVGEVVASTDYWFGRSHTPIVNGNDSYLLQQLPLFKKKFDLPPRVGSTHQRPMVIQRQPNRPLQKYRFPRGVPARHAPGRTQQSVIGVLRQRPMHQGTGVLQLCNYGQRVRRFRAPLERVVGAQTTQHKAAIRAAVGLNQQAMRSRGYRQNGLDADLCRLPIQREQADKLSGGLRRTAVLVPSRQHSRPDATAASPAGWANTANGHRPLAA